MENKCFLYRSKSSNLEALIPPFKRSLKASFFLWLNVHDAKRIVFLQDFSSDVKYVIANDLLRYKLQKLKILYANFNEDYFKQKWIDIVWGI